MKYKITELHSHNKKTNSFLKRPKKWHITLKNFTVKSNSDHRERLKKKHKTHNDWISKFESFCSKFIPKKKVKIQPQNIQHAFKPVHVHMYAVYSQS